MKQVTSAIALLCLSVPGKSLARTKTSYPFPGYPVYRACIPSLNSLYLRLYGHASEERAFDLAYTTSETRNPEGHQITVSAGIADLLRFRCHPDGMRMNKSATSFLGSIIPSFLRCKIDSGRGATIRYPGTTC